MTDAALARIEEARASGVRFIQLQFTDIIGSVKAVTIPIHQLAGSVEHGTWFDGSSIEGFVRIEESDMYLRPDLSTFAIFPWAHPGGEKVARMICDIYRPDGDPFEGCPRSTLKRVIERARKAEYEMNAGPEAEFFLFQRRNGAPTTETHDTGSYFDLTPVDQGEDVRREIVLALEQMGFLVEAAHHEVAPGQHEIAFKYADALTTADNIATFKLVVRTIALQHGLHATFMPKPIFGIAGSGLARPLHHPDETRHLLSEAVDAVEIIHKFPDARVVGRGQQAADIQFSELKFSHSGTHSQLPIQKKLSLLPSRSRT